MIEDEIQRLLDMIDLYNNSNTNGHDLSESIHIFFHRHLNYPCTANMQCLLKKSMRVVEQMLSEKKSTQETYIDLLVETLSILHLYEMQHNDSNK